MIAELIGRPCSSVEKHEFSWSFGFGEGRSLSVECPWRLLVGGHIALADHDHEQQFGLPEPINAPVAASSLLAGKVITNVTATEAGDLTIVFDNLRLEIFNNSSGYEAWVLSSSDFIMVGRNG